MNKKIIKSLSFIAIAGIMLCLPFFAFAAKDKDSQAKNIYLAEGETIDDNYFNVGNVIDLNADVNGDVILAGTNINIRGQVEGDVFVAGQTINISGNVGGSVLALGSNITISGEVAGSIRTAGSFIKIENLVGKNVYAAGSSVDLLKGSSVGKSAHLAGAFLTIDGPIEKNLYAGGAEVSLNNTIKGNTTALIDDGNLTLGPGSVIEGNLNYRNNRDVIMLGEAKVLGETHKLEPKAKVSIWKGFGGFGIGLLWSLIGALIVGLVITSLFKNYTKKVADNLIKKVGLSFGWGALILFVGPIAIFICLVTLVGIPLGLLLLAFYIVSIYLTTIFAGFTLGNLIFKGHKKPSGLEKGAYIGAMLIGIAIYCIITSIPFIGWLIALAGTLWALGGMTLVFKKTRTKQADSLPENKPQ